MFDELKRHRHVPGYRYKVRLKAERCYDFRVKIFDVGVLRRMWIGTDKVGFRAYR